MKFEITNFMHAYDNEHTELNSASAKYEPLASRRYLLLPHYCDNSVPISIDIINYVNGIGNCSREQ